MAGELTLTINAEIGPEGSVEMESMSIASDVPPELYAELLVIASDAILRQQISDEMLWADPTANPDTTEALSILSSRLQLIGLVTHLPATPSSGTHVEL